MDTFSPRSCGTISFIIDYCLELDVGKKIQWQKLYLFSFRNSRRETQTTINHKKSKIQINSMNKILYVIHIDLQLNLLSHKLDKGGIKQSNLGSLQCSGTKNMMWLFISRVTLIIHISLCIDQICIVIC